MKKAFVFMLFVTINTLAFTELDGQNVVYLRDSSTYQGIEMQVKRYNSYSNSGFKAGYQGIVEIGYGQKVTKYGSSFPIINVINGCRIHPNFYLGFGTGLRLYFDKEAIFNTFAAYPVIPFFVDFRANFNIKNVSAYSALDVGYSFDASYYFEGVGFYFNPTVGVRFIFSDKLAMNIGAGYEMQFVEDYVPTGSTVNFGAVNIIIGISFQ